MTDRLIVIFALLCSIGAALFVASDEERLAALRGNLGLGEGEETRIEVARLAPPVIETEIARLSALTVPGRDPATPGVEPKVASELEDGALALGVLADAARACRIAATSLVREPKLRAKAALLRYLLVFGAIGADPKTPLLEPRFRPLGPLLAAGPEKMQARLAKGEIDAGAEALLAEFHAVYRDVDHPLYNGLQIYPKTFETLDFEALVDGIAANPGRTLDCVVAKTLPVRPEVPALTPSVAISAEQASN